MGVGDEVTIQYYREKRGENTITTPPLPCIVSYCNVPHAPTQAAPVTLRETTIVDYSVLLYHTCTNSLKQNTTKLYHCIKSIVQYQVDAISGKIFILPVTKQIS